MTIKDAIQFGNEQLHDYSPSYRTDVRIFLSEILKLPISYLLTYFDRTVTDAEMAVFKSYINRRINHEPVAYILGKQEFMGLEFTVREGVLIPRPDTEISVETAREIIKFSKYTNMLDLCCGSGCIGISLACMCEDLKVVCADISETALKVTKENIDKHDFSDRVKAEYCDVLSGTFPEGKFDLIVSNPPYIRTDVIETLDADVRDFEPHLALDGGSDGMIFYKKILENAKQMLNENGTIIFEIGYDQKEDITNLAKKHSANCVVYKDYGNNDRVAVITFN